MEWSVLNIRQLWTLVHSGDKDALDELVMRFEPLIVSLSRIRGRQDEDVAQDIRETLVRAVKRHKQNVND